METRGHRPLPIGRRAWLPGVAWYYPTPATHPQGKLCFALKVTLLICLTVPLVLAGANWYLFAR